jgi:acylglycerol lipase
MTDRITASDGTPLLVRTWPAAGTPWASALVVHGVGEHSGRYARMGSILARSGVEATAFDLRGHGGSGGRRGDVERWDDHLDDIALLLSRVRADGAARPVALVGHSMGGLLAAEYALSARPAPDLLVLSAPGLDDGLPAWQHALAPIAARVVPTASIRHAWGPEALSRDPQVGRLAHEDPGCPPAATLRLGAGAFAAQRRVRGSIGALAVPTLVIHGGDDVLVPVRSSEVFDGMPGVTRRVYPGLRHEVLNEPEGPQVAADIVDWLRTAVGVGVSPGREPLAVAG